MRTWVCPGPSKSMLIYIMCSIKNCITFFAISWISEFYENSKLFSSTSRNNTDSCFCLFFWCIFEARNINGDYTFLIIQSSGQDSSSYRKILTSRTWFFGATDESSFTESYKQDKFMSKNLTLPWWAIWIVM